MFNPEVYELLDFGRGRKLERFGPWLLDRPCPAAEGATVANPRAWSAATAAFHRSSGEEGAWTPTGFVGARCTVRHEESILELTPTPFGHVGLFPEQAKCWDWIAKQVRRCPEPPKVLNLFAYTGGSTLAAAAAGASVAHVDAAKASAVWARRNAMLSGLGEAPVRWLVEDAMKFARRETRRGNRYDAVILDPPTYGHGPKGEPWKLAEHLLSLLEICGELTDRRPRFLLLTCHSPGIGRAELAAYLADGIFGHCSGGVTAWDLSLETADRRRLPAGVAAAWPA